MTNSNKKYISNQRAWIKKHKIKKGDLLWIGGKVKTFKAGWRNSFVSSMQTHTLVTFKGIDRGNDASYGIAIEEDTFHYPFFNLKPVFKK